MNRLVDPLLLEPELADLVRSLRSESDALKECFTKYSFHAIAMSVGILGVVARFAWSSPATALISIAASFIVLMTRRIGTYKYAAANRLTAYELHLHRTRNIPPHLRGTRWKPYMRYIGWEEAMRAWRLVHATLFGEVYVSRRFWPNFYRKPYKGSRPLWFRQQSMLGGRPGVRWHPGSYLRTQMLMLGILAWAAVACLIVMTYCVHNMDVSIWWILGSWAVTIAMAAVTGLRLLMDNKRRLILEDGLLSINSCAVVWQAVVIAHYSALDRARSIELATEDMGKLPAVAPSLRNPQPKLPDGSGFKGYTYWLADEAYSLAAKADNIDDWIAGTEENSMKNEEPKIKELTERQVAFVSFTGNYMGNPQIFAGLFSKLCGWAGPKGLISPESVFLSSYQDDPKITPPDELKLDVCMGISSDTKVDSDIQKKVLPGGQYAVMHTELVGPEEYGPAWNVVVEWMEKNNYEVDMSRPSYEIYLNNPEDHPEKHHIIDICMSVKEKLF